MESHTRQAEWTTDEAPRWGYEQLEEERGEMAAFLGCKKEELAFTHNCTEAMSIVAGGLDLKAGDEVLLTNQEHPGGYSGWRMRAARTGIVVREIEIPVTPKDPGELTDRMISAIGPKTRVMMFSGITSPTGLRMPVQELCRAARERGVISVVDGAHMDGQVHVNLAELGCDYFTGSPHKWMFAPAGCGLLYGRDTALDKLWPAVCNSGWDNATGMHAARFIMVGTNNRAIFDGMIAGLRFLKALGPEAVYARQHHLARLAVQKVRERSYVELVTPDDDRMFGAMLSIRFKESELTKLFTTMREENIYVIGGQRSRLSANIYARPSDIDAFFEVCDRFLKKA
jgi:selenocysteine lyase/cysteine desulfurase